MGDKALDTLGEEVRRLRKTSGLTQKDMAAKMGLSQSYLAQIETGDRRAADGATMNRLCSGLGVPLDHFVKYVSPGVTVPPPPVHSPIMRGGLPLPFLGDGPCGRPSIFDDLPESTYEVTDELWGAGRFVMRAVGYSLARRGIIPGDRIVFEGQNTAENGEIVVAVVDSMVTFKVYSIRRDGREVIHELLPDSDDPAHKTVRMKPGGDDRIHGVFVGLIRVGEPVGKRRKK